MLKLGLFVFPLGLDTFAVAAALGIAGLPRRERLRVSLAMSSFELVMPVIGLVIGRGLGAGIGNVADYLAGGFLIVLGGYLICGDENEEATVASLSTRRGLALLAVGLSVNLDELAIGFTIGLLGLSIWLAIIVIGAQAFAFAQLGLRLGSRLGAAAREWAGRLAGLAPLGLGIAVLAEKLAG